MSGEVHHLRGLARGLLARGGAEAAPGADTLPATPGGGGRGADLTSARGTRDGAEDAARPLVHQEPVLLPGPGRGWL